MIAELTHLQTFATNKLLDHGLTDKGWRFTWNSNKERMGVCKFHEKTIGLSSNFVANNPLADLEDCILHEIAHALAGPGHGHDSYWRHVCVMVGAKPERCYDGSIVTPKANYRITCNSCGRSWERYRLKKGYRTNFRSVCCRSTMTIEDLRG